MQVNGIIAEYNPFHNGHKYHIEQCRKATGADYTIVVLGSNFTQRGEPALLDKFVRARMALEGGADLVIELPISHSASSAEFFAMGGVSILDQLGVCDYLCFGSECGDVSILQDFAKILLEESSVYVKDLKSALSIGHSYPRARNRAITVANPDMAANEYVLSSPNNILGIEYMKALLKLESSIKPFTILRAGSDYHDPYMQASFCSALALRQAILSGLDLSSLSMQMPESAYELMISAIKQSPPVTTNDFSNMLLYKLLMEQDLGFSHYMDVSTGLSDRIKKRINHFEGYTALCDSLRSKDMTHTRIYRCILHILLDMKQEDYLDFGNPGKIPYARVLGFRKEAGPLLNAIKKNTSIPFVTKLADAKSLMSPHAYELLCKDLRRGSVYESVAAMKAGRQARDERQIPIEII